MAEVVSARLGTGLLERLDDVRGDASRGAWVADLVTRELTAPARADGGPVTTTVPPGAAIGTLGPGIPSPGVLCFTPGCHERDTAKYGHRQLPLCPACAHAACGQPYNRPARDLPPSWRAQRPAKESEPA